MVVLENEAVGLSLDKGYRGVSIRIPFSASFLNPFFPKYDDPKSAAIGMVTTMIHELAHHTHRSEKDLTPVFQDILTQLLLDPKFNFRDFMQRAITAVSTYHDVMTNLRSLYINGNVESRGKRFEVGAGAESSGSSGSFGDPTRGPAVPRPVGATLNEWAALSTTDAGRTFRPGEGGLGLAAAGGDASFGRDANRRALDSNGGKDVPAYTRQPETEAMMQAVEQAFNGNAPSEVKALGAHADSYNWFYKYLAGILELASANPRFTPLLRYVEKVLGMHRTEATAQDRAVTVVKNWRSLGAQVENVGKTLDNLTNMTYLTPDEVKNGVVRQPTAQEMQDLLRTNKVDQRGAKMIADIREFLDKFLEIVAHNAMVDATRLITDPVKAAQRIDEIRAQIAKLKQRPYFPFMRYGLHFVTVKDVAGNVIWHETFERHGYKSAERQQQARKAELIKAYGKDAVTDGVLPEQVGPLIGMPRVSIRSYQDAASAYSSAARCDGAITV